MPDAAAPSSTSSGCLSPAPARPRNLWLRLLATLAARIRVGHCTVRLPDGGQLTVEGSRETQLRAALHVRRPRAARRLALGGSVGFAEAYLDGDWECRELPQFLELALKNEDAIGSGADGVALLRLLHRLQHLLRANSRRGSRRNIARHYDLGNDFYALWLDAGMTYSSAVFGSPEEPLHQAQERKYRQLAAMLALRPGQHVLEIGCGWGGFAELAAADYGCRVTALTLSREQADFARARLHAAGLADRVDIRMQDYRDVRGTYDRIASIEMFEAVGEAYWPTFFDIVRQRLRPGGIAGMQVITIEDARFARYRKGADFIQRYIFPGGMLPSPSTLSREVARAGLRLADCITFGASYALTLARWQQRFQHSWPRIRALGFDERFKRMWEYYLAYCEAGFRAAAIDVCQLRIEKPA